MTDLLKWILLWVFSLEFLHFNSSEQLVIISKWIHKIIFRLKSSENLSCSNDVRGIEVNELA